MKNQAPPLLLFRGKSHGELSVGRRAVPPGIDCLPCLLRRLKKEEQVHIVHQHLAHGCDEAGEGPLAVHILLHHGQQQVGGQCHPYLGLYGVDALAVEVFQREVQLELLGCSLFASAIMPITNSLSVS